MTEHEQRIAIATWCGWQDFHKDSLATGPTGQWMPVPNYTRDLNAVHEAEKGLDQGQRTRYIFALQSLCGGQEFGVNYFATAAQRTEALLRVLGLWKERADELADRRRNEGR